MEAQVTCPKCRETVRLPARRTVRKYRCGVCDHEFVPLREGVPCPSCGILVTMPEGRPRRKVSCTHCSFEFRLPRWWEKRWNQAVMVVVGVLVILSFLAHYTASSNWELAEKLYKEYDEWKPNVTVLSDDINGMPAILEGIEAFETYPEWLTRNDFNLETEPYRKIARIYLDEKERSLQLIYRGLEYQWFLFPADREKGPGREAPDLVSFKTAARTLVLKGRMLEREGRIREALGEYFNALRLGRALSNCHSIIARAVETAVVSIGLQPVIRVLAKYRFAEEQSEYAYETLVEIHSKGGRFFDSVEADRQTTMRAIADTIEGKGDPFGVYGPGMLWYYSFQKDVDAWDALADIYREANPSRYWTLPPEVADRDKHAAKLGRAFRTGSAVIAARTIPGYALQFEFLVMEETLWRGAITLAAIRLFEAKHARLPETLAEVDRYAWKELRTDPYSGRDMVYHRVTSHAPGAGVQRHEAQHFDLYSVGLNGVDDGGMGDAPIGEEMQSPKRLSDIVFSPLVEKWEPQLEEDSEEEE